MRRPEGGEVKMTPAKRDIVVVGASAGGLDAVRRMIANIPPDIPAAMLLVVHTYNMGPSLMPEILSRVGTLPASHAEDGAPIQHGRILIAPPDRHLLVEDAHVHLTRGPKENHTRPAVNPLFRSAAAAYGPRVIGVVLSGALDDGVAGLWEIKRQGGLAIAQSPEDAVHPNMPASAIANVPVDHIAPAGEIGSLLGRLCRENVSVAAAEVNPMARVPINITCPECRGALNLLRENNGVEFQCRVKHTYSPEAMLSAHLETQERALWAAVVALEEGADLAQKLGPYLSEDIRPRELSSIDRNTNAAREIRRLIQDMNPEKT
jgi:two-component system chemotaxis response regulator CheB